VYAELVRLHRDEGLSFAGVTTFNLDEYYPITPDDLQSYHRFMREHLFDHVDIDPRRVHIPDGTVPAERVHEYTDAYEKAIRDAGGLDLQILGIGRSGHIGFNEPGSARESRTRLITLDRVTRRDAASDFFGLDLVPRRAITMGVGTILDARRVILMAFGEHKADVVAQAVEGPSPPTSPPASCSSIPTRRSYRTRRLRPASRVSGAPGSWSRWRGRRRDPQGGDLAGPQARQADPQADRRGLHEAGLQDLVAERGPPTTSTWTSSARWRRPSPGGPAASRRR